MEHINRPPTAHTRLAVDQPGQPVRHYHRHPIYRFALTDDTETPKCDNPELQLPAASGRRAVELLCASGGGEPARESGAGIADAEALSHGERSGGDVPAAWSAELRDVMRTPTPETNRRPFSPADSLFETTKWMSFPNTPRHPHCASPELDERQESANTTATGMTPAGDNDL
ncbi:hypothetical protein C8J57DRAFT_1515473 [Mycena rebaudengoi]|nr:hypothetical protein C8J57DRAFT_1515473 [Mycena rebaudengoi]